MKGWPYDVYLCIYLYVGHDGNKETRGLASKHANSNRLLCHRHLTTCYAPGRGMRLHGKALAHAVSLERGSTHTQVRNF